MSATLVRSACVVLVTSAWAATCYGQGQLLGTGTENLLGNILGTGDLTDIGNNGNEDDYTIGFTGGFDADFFSSDEPGFHGGENAFNVFDNVLGPGNAKWCCGTEFPQIVGAIFPEPFVLSNFTVSSANDVPNRDPRVWTIDGSNDGVTWTTIYEQNNPDAQIWNERFEVRLFENGVEYNTDEAFFQYRMSTTATGADSGAFFQIGEIEFFGDVVIGPFPVAGPSLIGDVTISATIDQDSLQFGPEDTGPGLVQEWYNSGNPGDKAGVDAIFAGNVPVVPGFRSEGGSWWTGSGALPGVQTYPPEVQPQLTDQYTVRLTGEILIEESGLYTFLDGVDDFTYLAIDTDKSGVAGDNADEVLINDNSWTNPIREANGGGGGWAEVNIEVDAGGEWLGLEFNMAEGGGGDHGTLYWDYDTEGPAGQRLQGLLVPFADQAFFSPEEAAFALIPDTHLRGTTAPIIGGAAAGSLPDSPAGWAFEVNGDDGTADAFVLDRPLDSLETTLDVDGVPFEILAQGTINEGDSFQIVMADNIIGTPEILTEGWSWDGTTGSIVFGAVVTPLCGDFDGDGDVDVADRTIQVQNWTGALAAGEGSATFEQGDCDGDGDVDTADQTGLIQNWTGALAGNVDETGAADLIYNPADGSVVLDASSTNSGVLISFVLGTDQNDMRPENFVTSENGSAGPFIDVGTNTDAKNFQIGQTDPINQGAGPTIELGAIFPAGIQTAEALSEYLTLAEYASELGAGGTFDLKIVPEPSGLALVLFGILGLVLRRRR